MKIILTSMLIALTTISFTTNAQKVKLTKGNLAFLKTEKVTTVEFSYDGAVVGKKDENDYVTKKAAEYNKKEPGTGDKWVIAWNKDKTDRFPAKFIQLYNENVEGSGCSKIEQNTTSKYKMIVKTTYMNPGYNVGISRAAAVCNYTIQFVETANPSNVVAEVTITGSTGQTFGGFDFETGVRLGESYALAGKSLGKFVKKMANK
ncbi:MAG: hypothetical protein ABI207_03455 [Crocinitomicaceae bacterium]